MDPKAIGARIKEARLRIPSPSPPARRPPKGLDYHPISQPDMADLVGVSMSKYTRWEKGDLTEFSVEKLGAFAKALGVTIDHLLGTDQVPSTATPESHVEYDPEAMVPIETIERVVKETRLERPQAERLRAMRWSIGLPSEATLRSYALDLANPISRSHDNAIADESRADVVFDLTAENKKKRRAG